VKDDVRRQADYGVLVEPGEFQPMRGGLQGESLVLCDQIYTFFGEPQLGPCDIDQQGGVRLLVGSGAMVRICERLKDVFGDAPSSIRGRFSSRFKQGDVLATGDGTLEDEPEPWLLVVSSNRFNADHRWPLIVVIPICSGFDEELPLRPMVELNHIATGSTRRLLAGCQDILVQDTERWRFRKIGHVSDLTAVRLAIHHYLGIVMAEKNEPQGPPRFSEADLAKSARADREASNRFGLAFRERQKETFRYLLEREEREAKHGVAEPESGAPESLERTQEHLGWEIVAGSLRRLIGLSPGQFRLATEGAPANLLGSPTQTFECDLTPRLAEMGMASEFESFKLVCVSENVTKVDAILVPKSRKENVDRPIEVVLLLSRSVSKGKGKHATIEQQPLATIRLFPFSSRPSTLPRTVNIDDPETFSGQLEIRVREAQLDDLEPGEE
jgi:hypothetical protein